jgi:hypothetical protein
LVDERGLAVVDVGNNGNVANIHRSLPGHTRAGVPRLSHVAGAHIVGSGPEYEPKTRSRVTDGLQPP